MVLGSTTTILFAQAQINSVLLNLAISRKTRENLRIYREFQADGFDYIYNPHTGEWHDIRTDKFQGSHNLELANLEDFIGIQNIGALPIHCCADGERIKILELGSGRLLDILTLNKCKFCFLE